MKKLAIPLVTLVIFALILGAIGCGEGGGEEEATPTPSPTPTPPAAEQPRDVTDHTEAELASELIEEGLVEERLLKTRSI